MRAANGKPRAGFCPLALVGDDEAARRRAAQTILDANGCGWFLDGPGPLAEVLARDVRPVLERLRELQRGLDGRGVMAVDFEAGQGLPEDLLLAMTLRDCAVFVRVQKSFRTGGRRDQACGSGREDAASGQGGQVEGDGRGAEYREGWYDEL